MAERDQTIVLTCLAGSKEWSAVCPDYPEHVVVGSTSVQAVQAYSAMLWRMHYDKERRLDKCHRLMRDEIRRFAGIPEWAINFPSWLLWKKKERTVHRARMDEIVYRLCAAKNMQDLSYEELTKLCIAEFNGLIKD
jgi:hypothetical protein